MSDEGALVKIKAATAAEVCAAYEPAEAARTLLRPGTPPEAFLQALNERQFYHDAVQFLAHALPQREAVWWACLCAGAALGEEPPAEQGTALAAAKAWVYEPRQENCHAAMAAAEAAGFDTAAGWAAVAAFWSGETLAPADVPAVPPTPGLVGKAVAGAVILAAVSGPAEKAAEVFQGFLQWGLRIARGVPAK